MSMLRRNLPIFLVFGAALVIGVGVIIAALATSDDATAPTSTLSEFAAEQAAKRAYYATDPTVSLANCTAQEYDEPADTWQIECVLDREGAIVRTTWVVTPDGVVTRADEAAGS